MSFACRVYPHIPRVTLDRMELAHSYLLKNRPIVIAPRSNDLSWHRRWAPLALVQRFGDCPIEAEETRNVYVGERPLRTQPLACVIDGMMKGDQTFRWKGLEFLRRVPGMRRDLEGNPAPTRDLLPHSAHHLRDTLWIAPKGTTSSLHHDGNFDNLNVQIAGRKLFILIPPPQHLALHIYGSAESPVNPFAPDLERFPRFAQADPVQAMLYPGDTLLIPKYWWHCVATYETSVNLSTHFSWDDELSPIAVLKGAPLLHRTLTIIAAAMKQRGLHKLAETSRRLWWASYQQLVPRIVPQERHVLDEPEWTSFSKSMKVEEHGHDGFTCPCSARIAMVGDLDG